MTCLKQSIIQVVEDESLIPQFHGMEAKNYLQPSCLDVVKFLLLFRQYAQGLTHCCSSFFPTIYVCRRDHNMIQRRPFILTLPHKSRAMEKPSFTLNESLLKKKLIASKVSAYRKHSETTNYN